MLPLLISLTTTIILGYFEKSNLFLENIIATVDRDIDDREVVTYLKSPVGDGGVWNLFYNLGRSMVLCLPRLCRRQSTLTILRRWYLLLMSV